VLLTCQTGFESLLARELREVHGLAPVETGPGWVRVAPGSDSAAGESSARATGASRPQHARTGGAMSDFAFAHLALLAPLEVRGTSVNALAARVGEFFVGSLQGEPVTAAWPCVWLGPLETVGLSRRIAAVEDEFARSLRRRLARVARLATPGLPRGGSVARGLFVFFSDFGRAWVAREAVGYGQRRMADDAQAPSRSYLKIEEAYGVLDREPQAGETVCDLGAAPGGWSYSAAKRGARVVAVDNGPLKGGARYHPHLEHRREDAFGFHPPAGGAFDWLFCDLVEEPHHVLRNIVAPWLERGWCRRFVVNLKFGRVDPIALLQTLRAPDSPLIRHAPGARIRHLYHDREEFTVVGEVEERG
jgi:23S rRNA (cytidine2498-2'-O)-methyltransferase